MTRAMMSAPPPTANGMTNSTSLVGFQSCAEARPLDAANAKAAAAQTKSRRRMLMVILPDRVCLFICCFANYAAALRSPSMAGRSPFASLQRYLGARRGQDIEQIGFVADIGDAAGERHARDIHEEKQARAGAGLGAAGDRGIAPVGGDHHTARARRAAVR